MKLLSGVKSFLSPNDLERITHAFVPSRMDDCNSLFAGISQSSITRLKMVQNSAARFLTGVYKCEHITPILMAFNWLPVHHRVDF